MIFSTAFCLRHDTIFDNGAKRNEGMKTYYFTLCRFLKDDVWRDPVGAGKLKIHFYQIMRVILLTVNGLKDHYLLLRASALSYSTLLAIVPILAIAFSVMKGLGVQTRLEQIAINYLTAQQEELSAKLFEYIANTDFKVLGALGTVMLIYTVLVMLGNVEKTFNHFWGVTRPRHLVRRVSDYISLLILSPLLLVVATATIASLPSSFAVQALSRYDFFQWFFSLFHTIIPKATLWFVFTAIYILVPNTKVKFVPALAAGIVSATLWECAFIIFTSFNTHVTNYNKIYGTFAALPIFIIWLYISWIIVLIGAQLSHIIQNIKSLQKELTTGNFSCSQRENMAVLMMLAIAELFHRGLPQRTVEQLANKLSMPVRIADEIIQILCDRGLIHQIAADESVFQPARNPALITLFDICHAMRCAGEEDWTISEKDVNQQFMNLNAEIKSAEQKHLEKVTLLDLVGRSETFAEG